MYNCMELLGHISLEKLHDDIAFFFRPATLPKVPMNSSAQTS